MFRKIVEDYTRTLVVSMVNLFKVPPNLSLILGHGIKQKNLKRRLLQTLSDPRIVCKFNIRVLILERMSQLNIVFENLNKFHFEGEKVRVKLEVNLEKSTTVSNIVANFVGSSSYVTNNGKQHYMTSKLFTKNLTEIYFDDVLPLFIAENKEASHWSPGIQVFTFDYQLPHNLPSSIEFPRGCVRYTVHVIADLDGETHKKSEHFTIVSKTDVIKDAAAQLPGVLWRPETQCCLEALVCMPGSVRAFFHIAKRGYVPGENIHINAEICNFYRFPIEWVKATLMQIIKHKGSKGFLDRRAVTDITRGCILPSETQTWRSEAMLIPAIPPTSYPPKKLIIVKYILCFQVKPSWQGKPIEMHQKVVIGTVKLMECDGGEEQGQGEGEGMYSSKYYTASNLEPCIFGPHSIDEGNKQSVFSPLYPMFVAM